MDLIHPLARALSQELESFHGKDEWTIIPIPMPRMRRFLRGYNQAELIARELSTILSVPLSVHMLARTGTTSRQVKTRTKQERIKNQRGTFKVTDTIHGKKILLIDDVFTTGATLEEARKTLLQHGATTVRAATLAH